MTTRAPYLQRRGNTLTFRIAVPPDLRIIVGRREITRALGTSDTRQAVPQALQFAGLAKRAFEEIRAVTGPGGKRSGEMSAQEMHEALDDLYADMQMQADKEHAERERELVRAFDEERAARDRRHLDALRSARAERSKDHADAIRVERIRAEAQREALLSAMQALQGSSAVIRAELAPSAATIPIEEPLPAMEVFEAWAKERGPALKTIDSFRSRLKAFINFLGHDDLRRVTKRDAVAWKDHLVDKDLSAGTIRDGYLAAVRTVCTYACDNARMEVNPFSRVRVLDDDEDDDDRSPFTDAEAAQLLAAAQESKEDVYRWTPVVLAYTGCRIEEVVGANAGEVRQEGGVWVLDLTSKRRRLKNKQSRRLIPLHQALIDEGFVEYAQSLPPESPLFPHTVPDKYGKRSSAVSKRLGRQLRNLGITDPLKVAGHSWRHRFADLCRNAGISEEQRLQLTGHADAKVGNSYGIGHNLLALKEQIDRIPSQGVVGQLKS